MYNGTMRENEKIEIWNKGYIKGQLDYMAYVDHSSDYEGPYLEGYSDGWHDAKTLYAGLSVGAD